MRSKSGMHGTTKSIKIYVTSLQIFINDTKFREGCVFTDGRFYRNCHGREIVN